MRARATMVLAVALLALAGCGGGDDPAAGAPGSTLRATLVDRDGDGALEPGPGEPLRDRAELGRTGPPGRVLATFAQLTDLHVRDEESPARVPFLDRLGGVFRSTFRPHEALSPQVLAAAVRSVNAAHPGAVLVTGDIVDSPAQAELDQALALLDGGGVRPDTGARGYDGVQEASDPDPLFYRPDLDAPRHPGLMAAAQRPFAAPGLAAPWLPALGNHDVLVQGEVPPTDRIDAVARGGRMVVGLDPALLPTGPVDSAAAVDALLAAGAPGRARRVPADPARRLLRPAELLARLTERRAATGPLRAAAGRPTLDYAADLGPRARVIVLDTADRAGGARGRLLPGQLRWLRAELRRAAGRAVVVAAHNPLDGTAGGEEALAALDATPGVVAVVHGNGHRNSIRPRRTVHGGYWLVGTSSLADFPQQARAFRLRAARGGYVLETWMLDHDGAVVSDGVDAAGSDDARGRSSGAGLAGVARELAFLDAQGGRPQRFAGGRGDRNARLLVPVRG